MSSSRVETAIGAGIVAVFFLVRLALLVVREPFFDELFTVWLARKPWGEIVPALRLDSGPPLYYFVARVPDILALRLLSLIFASTAMALVLTRRSLGRSRLLAVALLAIYPPAVLFAVDARAYALCGLFVAMATLALHEKRPFLGAAALVLAAYTHYYGVLFLPVLLLTIRPWRRAMTATALAGVLVTPAIYFASIQPAEAMQWLSQQHPLAALGTFAFVGRYGLSLFAPAPTALVGLSAVTLIVGVVRRWTFAPMVIVPVLLVIAFALAGRTVYFPMRFESVLAVPLLLWIATSLEAWHSQARVPLFAALAVAGAVTVARGTFEQARRDVHGYRTAAETVGRVARPDEPVIATGYLVLESLIAQPGRRIVACPPEQALHPGWRRFPTLAEAESAVAALPRSSFVWVGERGAPETFMLGRARRLQPLFANKEALVARVAPLDH